MKTYDLTLRQAFNRYLCFDLKGFGAASMNDPSIPWRVLNRSKSGKVVSLYGPVANSLEDYWYINSDIDDSPWIVVPW